MRGTDGGEVARDEGAVDERAKTGVLRRLEFQQRVALGEVEVGKMLLGLRKAEFLARRERFAPAAARG